MWNLFPWRNQNRTQLSCSAINMVDFIFLLMDRQETTMLMSCTDQPVLSHPLHSTSSSPSEQWDSWKPGTYVINVSCRAPPITLNLSHNTINAGCTVVMSQMEQTTWGFAGRQCPQARGMNHLGWLLCGKEPLFGGLVAGDGRRYRCSPEASFLSGRASKLGSHHALHEGASPPIWLFGVEQCTIRKRSTVFATET